MLQGCLFLCAFHTCYSQPVTRPSLRRFHFRPHHPPQNTDSCGYAPFRGFRRLSFDTPLTLLSFRTLPARSFHISWTHACPQVHRLSHTSFIRHGRVKEMCSVQKRYRHASEASRSERCQRSVTGFPPDAVCFGSVWEAPLIFPLYQGVSIHVVHAAAQCSGSVLEALLTFPLYRVRQLSCGSNGCPVFWKCRRCVGEARGCSPVSEALGGCWG